MGYETRMYIVKPSSSLMMDTFGEEGGMWYQIFYDKEWNVYHYGPDGNTKTKYDGSTVRLKWAEVVATLNLCKVSSTLFKKDKQSEYYVYSDGDVIIQDEYGEKLRQANIEDVISNIENDVDSLSYRRTKIALQTLKAVQEDFDNALVLFYGY